jgi:hypothetical protein
LSLRMGPHSKHPITIQLNRDPALRPNHACTCPAPKLKHRTGAESGTLKTRLPHNICPDKIAGRRAASNGWEVHSHYRSKACVAAGRFSSVISHVSHVQSAGLPRLFLSASIQLTRTSLPNADVLRLHAQPETTKERPRKAPLFSITHGACLRIATKLPLSVKL